MSIWHAFISPLFPWWCQTKEGEKKKTYPPVKTQECSQTVSWGGHNYENYLQLSKIRDQESSWEGAVLEVQKHKPDNQSVIFLGSELVQISKAGCCDGLALTYGFSARSPHDAMFVDHIRNSL